MGRSRLTPKVMKGRNDGIIFVVASRDSITTDIRNARNVLRIFCCALLAEPAFCCCCHPFLHLRWLFVSCLCNCGYNEESTVYNDDAFSTVVTPYVSVTSFFPLFTHTHRLGSDATLLGERNAGNAGEMAPGNFGHHQGGLRGVRGSPGGCAQQERGNSEVLK